MAVKVTAGSTFEAGSPVALFRVRRRQPASSFDLFSYDVSEDGERFLIATKVAETSSAPLSVVLNWSSDLDR